LTHTVHKTCLEGDGAAWAGRVYVPPYFRKIFFGQLSCKIRHFVNFSYIIFGQKCLDPHDRVLRLWPCTFAGHVGQARRAFLYGRSSVLLVMFLLFSTRNLRAPSTDHRETSPHDRNLCQFYKLTPKIRGGLLPPQKKVGAKNMQNFGRFYTTSDFDREYLRIGSIYPTRKPSCR